MKRKKWEESTVTDLINIKLTLWISVILTACTCSAAAAAAGVTRGAAADLKTSFPAPSIATSNALFPSYTVINVIWGG